MLQYYKTGEFASMIGVTPTTLRSWEKQGWLKPHHRSPSGYRFYTSKQLEDFLDGKLIVKKEEKD